MDGGRGGSISSGLDDLLALAKQRGSDADDGGAFFDGDLEIAAHAHAQLRQRGTEDGLGAGLEFAQALEIRARFLGDGTERRDGHETVDLDAREGVQLIQFGEELLGLVAELAGFAGEIDFQENGHGLGRLLGALGDLARDGEAIHALDELEEFNGIADLVGLEVADELPAGLAG